MVDVKASVVVARAPESERSGDGVPFRGRQAVGEAEVNLGLSELCGEADFGGCRTGGGVDIRGVCNCGGGDAVARESDGGEALRGGIPVVDDANALKFGHGPERAAEEVSLDVGESEAGLSAEARYGLGGIVPVDLVEDENGVLVSIELGDFKAKETQGNQNFAAVYESGASGGTGSVPAGAFCWQVAAASISAAAAKMARVCL